MAGPGCRLAAAGLLVLCGLAAVGCAGRGPAAQRVLASSPPGEATLAAAPGSVELTFTATPDPARSHLTVRAATGTVNAGPLARSGHSLRQPVSITAAGDVTVAYHVVFTNQDELVGSLRFTVLRPGAAGPGAGADPAAGHHHDIDPLGGLLVGVDLLVGLVVAVLLMVRAGPDGAPGAGDGADGAG